MEIPPAHSVSARTVNDLPEERPAQAIQLVWRAIWSRRSVLRDALLATLIINILALASALFTMQVYDRVIPHTGFATLLVLASGVLLALLFELILKQVRSHLMDREGTLIDIELGDWFFRRAQGIRMEHRPRSLGTLAAQLKGLEFLRGILGSASLFVLADVPFVVLFVGVIWFIGGSLVLVPLILLPLTLLVGFAFQRRMDRAIAASQGHQNRKAGILVESIDGIESIKATRQEGQMQQRWRNLLEEAGLEDDRIKNTSALSSNITATLQQAGYVVLVAYGAYLVVGGQLSMGGLIACSIISQRALGPIARLPSVLVQWSHAKNAMKNLDQMLSLPNELDEHDRTLTPEVVENSLRLERIEFRYAQNHPLALELPLLHIAPGERIGVIGPVGSGKSTLLKVASGLYRANDGQVFLGGLDMANIEPSRLRALVAYVPQEIRLLQGTLRENLLRGLPDPGDEVLLSAARRTGLIDLVNSHPLGLALPISEGGRGISGGQKQLIGITWLLLVDPQVLLLDEPTASMDGTTEARVLELLRAMEKEGKTMILSTHKTALLPLTTRLLVFNSGRIVLDGPRESVLTELSSRRRPVARSTEAIPLRSNAGAIV